eukprot:11829799-Alexandrium_andersonii.AAC.1
MASGACKQTRWLQTTACRSPILQRKTAGAIPTRKSRRPASQAKTKLQCIRGRASGGVVPMCLLIEWGARRRKQVHTQASAQWIQAFLLRGIMVHAMKCAC